MGIRKSKKLRTTFIEYVISLGILIIALMLVNYLIFIVVSIGVYPANYSEKMIQKNFEDLKNSPKVTMDLLTPMCSFGVYSEDGQFLYGNFSSRDKKINWDNYIGGKGTRGLSNYITIIHRTEGILIINYPLKMEYKSETLRRVLPNAELTIVVIFFIELIAIIILWSNRFSKKINRELKTLLLATEKIKEQDLDFNVDRSNINEIDAVLQGIDNMKDSLKIALEKQWLVEQQRKEQISALAHDIKTPLTIVKGNAGLLNETDMTEEQKSYCNYIEESSIQMEKYLQNLLAITKKEIENNGPNEIIYIGKLVNSLRKQGEALGKIKDININWNIDIEEDLYIKGHVCELERAFMNIITNAVDFSPSNSTITINGTIDNFKLIIQVIDQGKGFSKKMLKYGKEQFFMENESRTKTGHHGLGLYIANSIITKHNGELILSNNKSGGGAVMIKLPICIY
jgi:signal transduction histidine kinase